MASVPTPSPPRALQAFGRYLDTWRPRAAAKGKSAGASVPVEAFATSTEDKEQFRQFALEFAEQDVAESVATRAESRIWRIIYLILALAFLVTGGLAAYWGSQITPGPVLSVIGALAAHVSAVGLLMGVGGWLLRLHIAEIGNFRHYDEVRRKKEETRLKLAIAHDRAPEEAFAILQNVDVGSSTAPPRPDERVELLGAARVQMTEGQIFPIDAIVQAMLSGYSGDPTG